MQQCVAVCEAIPAKQRNSCAVRVGVIGRQIGTAWGESSNGDEVWGVVRGGELVTVMLRRSSQPKSPAAFRTTYVRS